MKPEDAKKLREPFPPSAIGKLPKPTKRDNPKGKCEECGGWHGLPAVHLDYVGHAATTDRLLSVDPEWTWEPMARGETGEPLMTNGGMWILLTVCGVTRPGWGDGQSMKEIIGDAIRNAAMRFGVALDLWAKEDLHDDAQRGNGVAAAQPEKPEFVAPKAPPKASKSQIADIGALIGTLVADGTDPAEIEKWMLTTYKTVSSSELTREQADRCLSALRKRAQKALA